MATRPRNYDELRNQTAANLIIIYDEMNQSTEVPLSMIRQELQFRENEKATAAMEGMTKQMRNMTIAILALTVVNVVLAGIGVYAVFK